MFYKREIKSHQTRQHNILTKGTANSTQLLRKGPIISVLDTNNC